MAFLSALGKILVLFGTFLAVFIQISTDPESARLSTPNISAERAVGTTGSNIKLHASADAVWHDLLDFKSYPTWSTKVPKIEWEDEVLKAGSNGTITADVPGKKPQSFPITIVSIDHVARRIVWKGRVDIPLWLYDAERVQEVVEVDGDSEWCEYRSWDTWRGPLAYIMQWTYKRWSGKIYEHWINKEWLNSNYTEIRIAWDDAKKLSPSSAAIAVVILGFGLAILGLLHSFYTEPVIEIIGVIESKPTLERLPSFYVRFHDF